MCGEAKKKYPCNADLLNQGRMRAKIVLGVEDTNTDFETSDILTRLRIVQNHINGTIDDYDDGTWSIRVLMKSLRRATGGFKYVPETRDRYSADLIFLVTERSESCGISPIGPSTGKVVSVVLRLCMTGYYYFGHELEHNILGITGYGPALPLYASSILCIFLLTALFKFLPI